MQQQKESYKVIATLSHPDLGKQVASTLGLDLIRTSDGLFANGEIGVKLLDSVRGHHIIIVATGAGGKESFNSNLMEVFLLCQACKISASRSITVVLAHFPYARSDKRDHRGSISVKFVVDTLQNVGVDRIMTFDLHSGQSQSCTASLPFDNLYCIEMFVEKLRFNLMGEASYVPTTALNSFLVSPDLGSVKRIKGYASYLKLPVIYMDKQRNYHENNTIEAIRILNDGDVEKWQIKDKIAIIVDDLIDSASTVKANVQFLKARGVKKFVVVATHGLFSPPADKNLKELEDDLSIDVRWLVTDTVPQDAARLLKQTSKFTVLSIANFLSSTLKILIEGGSIQKLFKQYVD